MPRTPIPPGITREDVIRAIDELKAGTVTHEFHESERYDLVYEGERYAPKAVLGVAARRVAGRLLTPADFSGGEGSTCFRILRELEFTVERKPGAAAPASINFVAGNEYNRREDIHGALGGQMQGGISTPSEYPLIFLFTGDAGDPFGYEDDFRADGVYLYTGEGQVGDMQWLRGNQAIKDSIKNEKQLLLFEQTRKGFVRFVGNARYLGHHFEQRPDKNGVLRSAIVFELEVNGQEGDAGSGEVVEGDSELTLPRPKTLADLRAAALLPSGKKLSPKQRQTVVHYRSEAVKDYVRRRAEGICEGCRQTAPFLNRKRQPYLEPHHTTRRADGGPDHPAHVIALCPTCHRRVHHGYDGEVYNRELIDRLPAIEEEAARR